jgi:predicted PolB exonuclease-like 3'-5' exonuclease
LPGHPPGNPTILADGTRAKERRSPRTNHFRALGAHEREQIVGSFLIFDIETIVDPELPIVDGPDAQKLPPPPHHRVIAVGALLLNSGDLLPRRLGIIGRETDEEEPILREFADLVDKHQPTLVTYNGRGFDLPVLAMRCFRHGVPFRGYYRSRDMRYRFSEAGHFDLMDYLCDYGASRAAKLDVMAKLCGMPGKVGVDGKDVGPLFHKGRIEEIRNYCLCDVIQTSGVFLRVQLLRGEIDEHQYLLAMRALIRLTLSDERVSAVAEKMDLARLLLGCGLDDDVDAEKPREPEESDEP